jgi:hypothetical protein
MNGLCFDLLITKQTLHFEICLFCVVVLFCCCEGGRKKRGSIDESNVAKSYFGGHSKCQSVPVPVPCMFSIVS